MSALFARPVSCSFIFAAALLPYHNALAQSTGAPESRLDRVEVTGSSIKRIEGETGLPVQVLTREDIERTGVTTTEQLLRTVSATSGLGATSVANTGAGGGQGGNNSVSLVSLRGLGSTRTLVLINGRRSAPAGGSNAVDIRRSLCGWWSASRC